MQNLIGKVEDDEIPNEQWNFSHDELRHHLDGREKDLIGGLLDDDEDHEIFQNQTKKASANTEGLSHNLPDLSNLKIGKQRSSSESQLV